MARTLRLPDGERYAVGPAPPWPAAAPPVRCRRVYAAAHVVGRPAANDAGTTVDWDETLSFRHYLWGLGFGVADAMDTAQRGMGMDWPTTAELIRRSAAEAATVGGALACGAGTDQLDLGARPKLPDVLDAYREQLEVVEGAGATAILMASRALAAAAGGPEDYLSVYGTLLREVRGPVILHWLGEMFDPALRGYWGSVDLDSAADTVLALIGEHADRVDGIKVSLLDKEREVALRRRLPAGVRLYTGDDFNYPELILGDVGTTGGGDSAGFSHALLGILDGIARPAAAALARLDAGDTEGYLAAMNPTVPLARHIFSAPTYHYKTGLAFLSWLNGRQSHFRMVGDQQTARDAAHLAKLFVLADRAGVLADPDLAVHRMSSFLGGAQAEPGFGGAGQPPTERRGYRVNRLALNQATTERWTVAEAVDGCLRAGIGAIGLWRRQVGEAGLAASAAAVRAAGLHVSSLCRGGFFTATDPARREAALADNRRAVDEAAELAADVLVLVSGGLPPGSRDLPGARALVADALDELVPYAARAGVRLGIEPLHPMFCADRCVVSTLDQALNLALRYPTEVVGVVVDTYHVWWDPDLHAQLARAGDRIASFQVCDWVVPLPDDMLLGRGHVGDGHIDFAPIAAAVDAAGYRGWVEVEIFNERIWATPGDETLRVMLERFDLVYPRP